MDPARELYERIVGGGQAELLRMRQEQYSETRLLDCKLSATRDGSPTKDDKQNLAEALSGFANSDGGVIVWGVDARRGGEDMDVVQELVPIPSHKRFLAELQTLTAQVVAPKIIGVDHHPLGSEDSSGKGFVLTYVPRTEGEPHMAVANGTQYRYYCRSGSSFVRMEHFMVADRFHRRPQPKLELRWRLHYRSQSAMRNSGLRVEFELHNIGLGIAAFPTIILRNGPGFNAARRSFDEKWGFCPDPRLYGNGTAVIYPGGAQDTIHPGTHAVVAYGKCADSVASETPSDIIVSYELYCEGFVHRDKATICAASIQQALETGTAEQDI